MKIRRALLALTSALILAACSLFSASPAQAQTTNCPYFGANITGDLAFYANDMDCVVNGNLTATGNVSILGSGTGNITVNGAILAGGTISVQIDNGYFTGQNITTTGLNKGISLIAAKDIKAGIIQSNKGQIQFHPNYLSGHGAGSNPVVIGGVSASSIQSQGGKIYVTNGGNGGIQITNGSALNTFNASGSGSLIVDACNENDTTACNSNLTLPSGLISTDSTGGPSGLQLYIAKTITANGTILSSSDSVTSASSPVRYIVLSAQTLNLSGNLSIYANGARPVPAPTTGGNIFLHSLGQNSASDGFVAFGSINIPSAVIAASPLTISGTGSLSLNALGLNALVSLQGKPFTYSAGAFNSYTNDKTAVTQFSSPTGSAMSFTGTSLIGVYASGPSGGGEAGKIGFYPGIVGTITPAIQLYANGTGSGKGGLVEVIPGSGNLKLGTQPGSILAAATGGNSGGGTVKILTPGNITFDSSGQSANVFANTGSNGDGGSLELTAGTIATTSVPVPIYATGQGTGKGGTIKIDTGTLPGLASGTNPLYLLAYGGAVGAGGKVEIHNANISYNTGGIDVHAGKGDGGTIQFTDTAGVNLNGTMSANAGATGDGNGGTINMYGVVFATISGDISADGGGSGEGGTISLTSAALNTMNLNGAEFSASGNISGSGKGGGIDIANGGQITVGNATFKANGGGTAGDGGVILLTVNQGTTPITVTTAKFEARGNVGSNQTGKGGNVVISDAKGTVTLTDPTIKIHVFNVINVDGGSSPGVTDMGSISLNTVTCHQWKTTASVYPLTGWDCITPNSGSNISTLVAAAGSLSPALQGQLATLVTPFPASPRVGLLAMNSVQDHEKFFGIPPSGIYDKVYGISSLSWLRVSSTFAQSQGVSNATLSGSPTIMVGGLVHELGHHFNVIWGPAGTFRSTLPEWTNLVTSDFATMDTRQCNTVFYQTTCDAYPGKTNSERFVLHFTGIKKQPEELFAAMFEHVESFLTGNPVSYQVDPELEKALDTMLLMKAYMSGKIASPPSAVQ